MGGSPWPAAGTSGGHAGTFVATSTARADLPAARAGTSTFSGKQSGQYWQSPKHQKHMHNKNYISRNGAGFDLWRKQVAGDFNDNHVRYDISREAPAVLRRLITIVGAVVAATFASTSASASGWGIRDNAVTLLPYSGDGPSYAQKINNSGDVVGFGYTSQTQVVAQAVLWSAGNTTDLYADFDWAERSQAFDINDNGVVVLDVFDADADTVYAMTWSGGTSRDLTLDIAGREARSSTAKAISNNGVVAGQATFWGRTDGILAPLTPGAAVWRNGEFIFLHDTTEGYYSSLTLTINNSGNMVAGVVYTLERNGSAALWIDGGTSFTFVNLGDLIGSSTSVASAINDDGLVAGRATLDGITRAVIWRDTEGTFTDLHDLAGGEYSLALGINEDGAVTGDAEIDGTDHAVVWMPGTDGQYELVDISKLAAEAGLLVSGSPDSPEGFLSLTLAYDINDYNQVVGYGPYFDGTSVVNRSFLLELEFVTAVAVPEPATWTVLAGLTALACVTLCRRRRRR
jgi:uncharacterized membrane protein